MGNHVKPNPLTSVPGLTIIFADTMSDNNTTNSVNKAAAMAGLLVVLLTISSGYAAEGRFESHESGDCIFHIYDYELKPQFERAIVFGVSVILDTYENTFGFSYPDNFKVKVVIFGNKTRFVEYQQKTIGETILGDGYFSTARNETVVVIYNNAKNMLKETRRMVGVIFHEANHMLLGYQIPTCPLWINEGLSEYFEGMNVFGNRRLVYLNKNRMKWCKHWAKNGFPVTPEEYLNFTNKQWEDFSETDTNAAYTIGYSLVYFMMSSKKTEGILKEMLWDFKRHGKDADSIKIINENFPGGFERFKKLWLKWIPTARPYRPLRELRIATKNNPVPETE